MPRAVSVCCPLQFTRAIASIVTKPKAPLSAPARRFASDAHHHSAEESLFTYVPATTDFFPLDCSCARRLARQELRTAAIAICVCSLASFLIASSFVPRFTLLYAHFISSESSLLLAISAPPRSLFGSLLQQHVWLCLYPCGILHPSTVPSPPAPSTLPSASSPVSSPTSPSRSLLSPRSSPSTRSSSTRRSALASATATTPSTPPTPPRLPPLPLMASKWLNMLQTTTTPTDVI